MDFIASPNLQVKGAIQWSGRRRDAWVLSAILIIAILPVQAAEFEPEAFLLMPAKIACVLDVDAVEKPTEPIKVSTLGVPSGKPSNVKSRVTE